MAKETLRLEVARPCPVSWDAMSGDERVRFCALCQKCVYNLSAMTLPEAKRIIKEREGNVCVRFFQREDGTVMTSDCAFGIAQAITRAHRWVRRGLGAVMALCGFVGAAIYFGDDLRRVMSPSVTGALSVNALQPPASPHLKGHRNVVGGIGGWPTEP